MEAAAERDDPGPAGDPPGELERAIDGFRAGVQEQDGVERVGKRGRDLRREARDRLGEADRRDRSDEPVDLRVDRRGHPGMGVAQGGDGDAVGEIEVGLAVGVDEAMALPVAPFTLEIAAQDGRQIRGDVHALECIGRNVTARPRGAA